MSLNLNQKNVDELPTIFAAVSDIINGPNSSQKKDCLRKTLSQQLRWILKKFSSHGDRTALTNYIKSRGVDITHRNLQRLFSNDIEQNLKISERTGFIALRHACIFFELSDEMITAIGANIIEEYLKLPTDNYKNNTY